MNPVNPESRYRLDNGKTCIEIRLATPLQLFDSRDPAPFRERDLDEHAVEYLIAAVEDIPFKKPIKILLSLTENPEKHGLNFDSIREAVSSHFSYELGLLRMRIKQTRKRRQMFMLMGLLLMVACLSLSRVVYALPTFLMKPILYEGLIIGGWVALWRPIDLLLFDWWPLWEKMRYVKKLANAEVSIIISS